MRVRAFVVAGLAWLAAASPPAEAADYVDLQLVLAVDVSGSMDYNEQQVQRQGYVQAFQDPEVIRAITSGPYGRIAVTYVLWAGAFIQETAVPWTIIGSERDAKAFAADLARVPYYTQRGTSLSMGLFYASGTFTKSGLDSARRTIDISGDGSNNDGPPLTPIRDKIVSSGITINGLPLLFNPSGVPGNYFAGLDDYYRDCVIGGPGSFVIAVKDTKAFGPAIRRKLILEIAADPSKVAPSIERVQLRAAPQVDCRAADAGRIDTFGP